ncbi:GxxExxY protein [Candidatus Uhrbacteria bacterium]|nr:GxxExxY protein [Candidatus Uhrbacteria bacterium]
MSEGKVRNEKLVLPELSYSIMGAIFEVSNELGTGYQEKYYYRAVKSALEKRGLQVKTQVYLPIEFRDAKIGNYFLDFLIEGKIVLELKIGKRFKKSDFDQIQAYLRATNTPLGIIVRLDKDGEVVYHRVLPPNKDS